MTMSPAARVSRRKLWNRVVIAWHRSKGKINRLLDNTPPKTRGESACRLPHEIVEMITTYLVHDLDALKACSSTCRSWYLAAVPYLHHTLILRDKRPDKTHDKLKPLSKLHKLDLLPLVKEIRVRECSLHPWFIPQVFTPRDLRYFSAFANVQTLALHRMEIHRFIPGIERYFEHFSPTLRSIALYHPYCTPRQLSHFLSLFSNLENIEIHFPTSPLQSNKTISDPAPVPSSIPRLQGRLELSGFPWAETWKHLITSYGNLQFRRMDLWETTGCAPILLEACAETLETLQFSVMGDPDGDEPMPSLLPEFNLSRLKVLRSLQIEAWAGGSHPKNHHTVVMDVFSTITSPVFSELVIILGDAQIHRLPSDVTLFETLRKMNQAKPFKLVFSVQVTDSLQGKLGEVRQGLMEALDSATSGGLLDFLDSPPNIRTAPFPIPRWAWA